MKSNLGQWEFGELFAQQAIQQETRKIYTVSELTSRMKLLLERQFGTLWISGEVSGCRVQSSGHIYFTLKDATAQIQCVLFKSARGVQRSLVADGKKLTLQGDISLYEPRGQYQLVVKAVEDSGQGDLALAFERLKQRLKMEGLFDESRKRPIPTYPKRIGIVTSPTGAALQDILKVFRLRHSSLDVILAPSKVQGEGAAEDIVKAIKLLNRYNKEASEDSKIDLILVTRGGGSMEDLWCFNEEIVARAIAASELPVISGVGHEIDFCISDFVADHRAATPTAAAEYITQASYAIISNLEILKTRLKRAISLRMDQYRYKLESLSARLESFSPPRLLAGMEQSLDDAKNGLDKAFATYCQKQKDRLTDYQRRIDLVMNNRLVAAKNRLEVLRKSLELLDPFVVLKRGYSITINQRTGKALMAAEEAELGDCLKTYLNEGELISTVQEVKKESNRRKI